ncbi:MULTISPECIES: GntR family transcriptional regulator [Pseudomonas]|uniref:GntR family transcriptional regulator n=1 Tax=Pseudomonas marincola TaxID=437900 RepID=A0A1I7BJ66_9PSED|nr:MULTISPECIES: GntR family transcriptional regulator [Pseudomonas]MBQ53985.1 GntR family transcriptional regulator [Pseudomonadaceae bacterium]NRH28469.1 GntR family transcriptional regulator [Pseudomonas sp. MS19]CAE6915051.1 DNA-binding transcriptional regulator, GntR family [Pseudomonas marincola]SFT87219.1 DNA-binding transcriptional regulator, GntR family [Pseudomonas marincola]HCP55399.1 GntR family transcriptional regulator [Pseudomonas sp.]
MKDKSPIGLETIEVAPLHEVVYQRLTHALMSGQIKPGQKLTSRKIAHELGTSDMPVRAALMKLQSLKALDQLPNGSLTLPVMTRQRFADLMSTRLVCEVAAARAAADAFKKAELKAIQNASSALTQAAKNKDIDDYLLRNYEFKFMIYRACHSESLIFLIETLWLQVGPFLRQFGSSYAGNLEAILDIDYHEEIVEALGRGDGDAAAEALRKDIADGMAFLLEHGEFQ